MLDEGTLRPMTPEEEDGATEGRLAGLADPGTRLDPPPDCVFVGSRRASGEREAGSTSGYRRSVERSKAPVEVQ